ncbi:MAG: MmpS family transport accessory protein [Dehalococcoidia bacterium]
MSLKLSQSIRLAVQMISCLLLLACISLNTACHQNDVVMYEVVGSAPVVDIQVTNPSGATDEFQDVNLPWRFSYEGFENSQAYVYAHNNTEEGGITVNIYVNGKLERTATSTGAYQTAVTYWDR